jgi:hypothetical protein
VGQVKALYHLQEMLPYMRKSSPPVLLALEELQAMALACRSIVLARLTHIELPRLVTVVRSV